MNTVHCGTCRSPMDKGVCPKCSVHVVTSVTKLHRMAPGAGSIDAICVVGHTFDAHRGSCPYCTGLGHKEE